MIERNHLFASNKLDYVRGKRPDVPCILCAVRDRNPEVANLEVYRDQDFLISLNLYPYNPGHLMIVPLRHVEWPDELTDQEALHLHHLQKKCLKIIRQIYPAGGFNLGYNLGEIGGGSIAHLHMHIVPRYRNEHGFMATLAHTHIVVEDPHLMQEKFQKAFENTP
ncbi:HIT family hydrolase [bacterium (Candidatus Blackallbacteria) CG17_big_fil_post_rev_8_21_14_2_50_48_46]|uniref:HIT family hydrolase n=1 Tax=bacterium (Candidatus Blackallbacteria) CG17_big_fil_post_rev_8_21_14_2_50_48_46 TaxID=2014261 RepID=A0A2M7G0C8_9BACT|nr:MAG: HIT family hydrolase [bacterium (Candidatus Blackallbacteria) CG18_big_fil_WC_8_21_14_2_50_49_26]PIW15184.1 MAG: HIT family hydrolase [bacterium (Candidatus Blackallbacteria) CG17_big_fil_post_rev_8_21_14_2_50_48_46]PIW50139.1 MAG: HIT family hydrolase [bacterium (Candidatus Blackallbacteria) CG13_big_fil_rev_8_21_14_2_50_49_14]